MATTLDVLCSGFPDEFSMYLNYWGALDLKEAPNYAYLRNLFPGLYVREGYKDDWIFDWSIGAPPPCPVYVYLLVSLPLSVTKRLRMPLNSQ